jgi:hypothetical protein
MKNLSLAALALVFSAFLAGCNAGGEAGDPNVGANPAPPESSVGKRPGTPGGPAVTAAPYDPTGGRGDRPGMPGSTG